MVIPEEIIPIPTIDKFIMPIATAPKEKTPIGTTPRSSSAASDVYKRQEPKYLYKAIVGYEDRSLAKKAGFRWNNPVQGAWTRKLSETEAIELDFKVEILN